MIARQRASWRRGQRRFLATPRGSAPAAASDQVTKIYCLRMRYFWNVVPSAASLGSARSPRLAGGVWVRRIGEATEARHSWSGEFRTVTIQ